MVNLYVVHSARYKNKKIIKTTEVSHLIAVSRDAATWGTVNRYIQTNLSEAPNSQTLPAHVLPSMRETKFHTHIKQTAVRILYTLIFKSVHSKWEPGISWSERW
jgi:hypothetical protein